MQAIVRNGAACNRIVAMSIVAAATGSVSAGPAGGSQCGDQLGEIMQAPADGLDLGGKPGVGIGRCGGIGGLRLVRRPCLRRGMPVSRFRRGNTDRLYGRLGRGASPSPRQQPEDARQKAGRYSARRRDVPRLAQGLGSSPQQLGQRRRVDFWRRYLHIGAVVVFRPVGERKQGVPAMIAMHGHATNGFSRAARRRLR